MRVRALSALLPVWVISLGAATGTYANSLVLHLPLDDGTGSTTASDASGNGHNGVLVGMDPATDWVTGVAGTALDFDGVNDDLVVQDDPALDIGTGDFTVSIWAYKHSDAANWNGLFGVAKWTTASLPGLNEWAMHVGLNQLNDDRPAFSVEIGTVTYSAQDDTYHLPLDTWHHLVGSREGSTLRLYVDGVLMATNSTLPPGSSVNNANRDLRIALNQPPGSLIYTDGIFDDLQIYDWALSDGGVAIGETAGDDVDFLFSNPGSPVPTVATESMSWGRVKATYR